MLGEEDGLRRSPTPPWPRHCRCQSSCIFLHSRIAALMRSPGSSLRSCRSRCGVHHLSGLALTPAAASEGGEDGGLRLPMAEGGDRWSNEGVEM